MKLNIQPLTPQERLYTYQQSKQLQMQTGSIGHLRGDMDSNGKSFHSTWEDHNESLKGAAFREEFDELINAMRFDEANDGILKDRATLSAYCHAHPTAKLVGLDSDYYGFRVNTQNYAYLMRLTPQRGLYNFYVYAYTRELLDKHLEQATKGIRFITPDYKDKFRLADGDRIWITSPNGENTTHSCRYIDETHVQVDKTIYHICEFAELMARQANMITSLRASLPDKCYGYLRSTGDIVIIRRGIDGYFPTDMRISDIESAKTIVREYNEALGVSKAQEEAMMAGSMFGWHVSGADPANYDENGTYQMPSKRERGARQ